MPSSEVLTLRLPSRLSAKLAKLAKSTDRSRSRLASDAIEHYLELNAWQVEAINEGIAAADAGQVVPHEDIKRVLRAWSTPARKRVR